MGTELGRRHVRCSHTVKLHCCCLLVDFSLPVTGLHLFGECALNHQHGKIFPRPLLFTLTVVMVCTACRVNPFWEWDPAGDSVLQEQLVAALSQVEGSLTLRLGELHAEAGAAWLLLQRAYKGSAASGSEGAQHSGSSGCSLGSLLLQQQGDALATELGRLSAQLRERAEQAREDLLAERLMKDAKFGVLNHVGEIIADNALSANPWQLGASPATAAAWAQWRDYVEVWEKRRKLLYRVYQHVKEDLFYEPESQKEAIQLLHQYYATQYAPHLRPSDNFCDESSRQGDAAFGTLRSSSGGGGVEARFDKSAFPSMMKEVLQPGAKVLPNAAAALSRELEALGLAACRKLRLLGERGAAEIAGMRLREKEEERRVVELHRWRAGDVGGAAMTGAPPSLGVKRHKFTNFTVGASLPAVLPAVQHAACPYPCIVYP